MRPKSKKSAALAEAAAAQQLQVELRIQIRTILFALPKGRMATLLVIESRLQAFGFEFTPEDLTEAIEWNHSRNLIDYNFNQDLQVDEWFLTEKGKARA